MLAQAPDTLGGWSSGPHLTTESWEHAGDQIGPIQITQVGQDCSHPRADVIPECVDQLEIWASRFICNPQAGVPIPF